MAARQTEYGTEYETDEAARETMRAAGDQAARSAQAMSDAAERTARSGAETAQRNSERMFESWRSGADAANQIAERSLDKVSQLFGLTGETARQALQQSTGNVQAMLETTTILTDGLQDLSGEWMRFVQDRAERNLEHFDRLLACRSMQECMAFQTQVARDQFEALLHSIRRTSEKSTEMADQAVRKMSETPLAPR
ncbi:MAG TPA: phasin family protein [Xanthobacteraceae bacterium]|nr:phasin family protein [Xanthobacteraceae bacterium]